MKIINEVSRYAMESKLNINLLSAMAFFEPDYDVCIEYWQRWMKE